MLPSGQPACLPRPRAPHHRPATAIAFATAGQIVAGSAKGLITLHAADGQLVRALPGAHARECSAHRRQRAARPPAPATHTHTHPTPSRMAAGAVRKLIAHPAGFASCGNDGMVKVSDCVALARALVAHACAVRCGPLRASRCCRSTRTQPTTPPTRSHTGARAALRDSVIGRAACRLCMLPSGELASCGEDGAVRVWDGRGGLVQAIQHPCKDAQATRSPSLAAHSQPTCACSARARREAARQRRHSHCLHRPRAARLLSQRRGARGADADAEGRVADGASSGGPRTRCSRPSTISRTSPPPLGARAARPGAHVCVPQRITTARVAWTPPTRARCPAPRRCSSRAPRRGSSRSSTRAAAVSAAATRAARERADAAGSRCVQVDRGHQQVGAL